MNTTATSILQFLNLAELGIGSAIACQLYRPLFENDQQKVKEIVALQGWFYKCIAIGMIAVSSIVMLFFPVIFNKMNLPLWYAYGSFSVLLFSSLLGYFVNYKQIVLSANQQEYKINFSYKLIVCLKILAQLFAVSLLKNGYVWWLVLEVVFTIIGSAVLNYEIYKTFPYLKGKVINAGSLRSKYPEVLLKIKQLFCHKIGSFVLAQSSPLVIFAFSTLTLVTVYGNYMLIIVGFGMLLTAIFNGLSASVGSLVAEGNERQIEKVFYELFSSRFYLISVCAYLIFYLSTPFVKLWIGDDYILDNLTVLLITIIFYLNNERTTTHSFINAYGLFGDIAAPVIEAVLNLGCSILLGYFYGLNGILTGVIISLFIIPGCWKPYYLFSRGFKKPIAPYIKLYIRHLVYYGVAIFISSYIIRVADLIHATSFMSLILSGFVITMIFGALFFSIMYLFESSMRLFTQRLVTLILNK